MNILLTITIRVHQQGNNASGQMDQKVWVRHFFGVDFGIFWVSSHWHLSHVPWFSHPTFHPQQVPCVDGKIIFRWWVIPSSRPLYPIARHFLINEQILSRVSDMPWKSVRQLRPCTWWSVSQRCCKDMCTLRCLCHRVKNRTCSRAHFRKLGWGWVGWGWGGVGWG